MQSILELQWPVASARMEDVLLSLVVFDLNSRRKAGSESRAEKFRADVRRCIDLCKKLDGVLFCDLTNGLAGDEYSILTQN